MVSKINFIVFFKKLFILIIIFSNTNNKSRIKISGRTDMNIILNNITEYKKSTKILDDRIVQWKKEIELKKIQLSQFQNQLNTERVLLTSELIADREIEINDYANEIIALQEKRFGPNGDRIKQRKKLILLI